MPFTNQSIMSQRIEFCILASKPGSNISNLCTRYGISRRTGYKWIKRFSADGILGLNDKSRRPQFFPNQTSNEIEEHVKALRVADPDWGSKKLHRILMREKEEGKYAYEKIPSKKTITKILSRNGLIDSNPSKLIKDFERFERQYPNELWQMDYKGWFRLLNKQQCHPLTITDDHSRFNICLEACKNQNKETVRDKLINVFRKYGLPYMMLADNAGPWGSAGNDPIESFRAFTELELWLIRLNIRLIHGRPYHPQTQGKEERFHRTLKQELIEREQFRDHKHCQERFDIWRNKYNCIRPHESLGFKTPSEVYEPSYRIYPERIKPYEYDIADIKRKVNDGDISFKNKEIKIGKAFNGEYVALRKTQSENVFEIYYCNQLIRTLTL